MEIQAIIFDKIHWNPIDASLWLTSHNFKPIKRVHETKNYYRYRIREPNYKEYVTKSISPGIKLILGS